MPNFLPLVRGGVQALYPAVRRVEFATDVAVGLNATEMRFKRRPPLARFVLQYTRISGSDTAAMRAFFEARRGTADRSWSFQLGAAAYSALTFEDDSFSATEDPGMPGSYSFTLRARQTQNPGNTAGAAGAPFPTLANGATAQLPYAAINRFAVLVSDNPIGMRYSWPWVASSFTGPGAAFPAGSLHGWVLSYPVLSDADLAVLETHFRNQWGRFGMFSLTDPADNTVYPRCRYDDDALEITHQEYNRSSLTLRILETN